MVSYIPPPPNVESYSDEGVGMVFLSFAFIIVYMIFFLWLTEMLDSMLYSTIIVIILPLCIFGLFLIF